MSLSTPDLNAMKDMRTILSHTEANGEGVGPVIECIVLTRNELGTQSIDSLVETM
jgi:hypothetical protein